VVLVLVPVLLLARGGSCWLGGTRARASLSRDWFGEARVGSVLPVLVQMSVVVGSVMLVLAQWYSFWCQYCWLGEARVGSVVLVLVQA